MNIKGNVAVFPLTFHGRPKLKKKKQKKTMGIVPMWPISSLASLSGAKKHGGECLLGEEQLNCHFQPQAWKVLAIFSAYKLIVTKLDMVLRVARLFFDLSEAFNTINSNNLLERLSNYHICGFCVDLLKSHLCKREQTVCIIKRGGNWSPALLHF
ncbi:uncharacterized protein [Euwallacea similis]|uniref:uncharacterized protein n=1 Tax=Euwallacea similis TaxID=1736056 RepID=UPI00344BD0D6